MHLRPTRGVFNKMKKVHTMTTRLIKLNDVMAITGLSRSHTYALAMQGLFPKQVKLTERSSAWVESEVQGWIDSRIAQRDLEAA